MNPSHKRATPEHFWVAIVFIKDIQVKRLIRTTLFCAKEFNIDMPDSLR